MVRLNRQVRAPWWAAEEYDIVKGRDGSPTVRPKPGADLRVVEPMRFYEESLEARARRRSEVAPHLSFAALGAWFRNKGRLPPIEEASERVCSWAARHGLLGLLLTQATRIVYPAMWMPFPHGSGGVGDHFIVEKTGAFWSRRYSPEPETPGVIFHPAPYLLPLTALETYFPGKTENFPVLISLEREVSEEARPIYGEPLHDILLAAEQLHEWFEILRKYAGRKDEQLDQGDLHLRDSALCFLNIFAETGAEIIEVDEKTGKYCSQWYGGTLLAALAKMMILDLTKSASLRECSFDGCFNLFTPLKRHQRYCSAMCQNADARRRARAKEKGCSHG